MKRAFSFLSVLIFLLTLLFNPFAESAYAGTAIKKSGSKVAHNYFDVNTWTYAAGVKTLTGAAAGTNTDTLIFYEDSAATRPFWTTSLRVRGLTSGMHTPIPDSLTYCVLAADDTADAVTLRTEYQIQLATGEWVTWGGNGDMTLAGSAAKVFNCFNRKFLPNVKHRVIAHPSTLTDGAYVYEVKIFPIDK